jgi:TolB-like protein
MTTSDVFLSYNREDQAVAKRFAEALKGAGLSVWWDQTLRSGEAYDQVTEEALRTAKAVVVLWSPRSVISRWVRAEASIADECGTLIPAKIEACDLPVMFRLTQTADLSHWPGNAGDPAWQAFLADVQGMAKRGHEKPQVSASSYFGVTERSGGVPFVAVLPIAHRGDNQDLDIFAEDLTEDVTRELGQNSFFRVIAAGTMAAWRDRAIDHRVIGRELGARYVIEGKVQQVGETVRLGLQVIEAATGGMLRSLRINRKFSEFTSAPDEVAVAVASELGEQITQIETARAMSSQAPFSGWDHVLRALALNEHLGPQGEHLAFEEARKAVAVAPDLGIAHALLAQWYGGDRALHLRELDDGQRREMHDHIKRAMQLDGDNPVILNCVAAAYASLGDREGGMRLAQRAVALAPNSPLAHFTLGHACFALGKTGDAIAAFTEQLRLAPRDLNRPTALMLLGVSFYAEGKWADAEKALDHSLSLHPDYHVSLAWKAVVAAQLDKEQVARDSVIRMREAEPGLTIEHHLRMLIYYPNFRERFAQAAGTLRSLWDETGGDP